MPNNHENTRLVDALKDVKPGELVVLKQKFNISHKRRVFLVVRCFTEPITYFEKEGEQLSFLQLFPCWMGEDAELYRWEKASPFYFERLEVKE